MSKAASKATDMLDKIPTSACPDIVAPLHGVVAYTQLQSLAMGCLVLLAHQHMPLASMDEESWCLSAHSCHVGTC